MTRLDGAMTRFSTIITDVITGLGGIMTRLSAQSWLVTTLLNRGKRPVLNLSGKV